MKVLDLFCGRGGWSKGFAAEGFECTGVDIKYLGYRYNFIYKDVRLLNPKDFQDYDVIVGSPPCRDFCLFAKRFGKTWKRQPPNPQRKA